MGDNSDEMSESSEDTFPQRRPRRNGFLRFLREYGARRYGMDLVEMSLKGGEAWSKLSEEEKEKYNNAAKNAAKDAKSAETSNQACADDDEDCDDGCCPRPRGRCGQPAPRCCPPPRKPCCRPKRKPCCRKPCCKPKRCCKPKPCCRPRRKPCCPKPCCNINYQLPGPGANNGYLNFLRYYRRKHCGMKARELVVKAARAWCRLPEFKKEKYRRMV